VVVLDYEIHNNHVVLILHDATRIVIYPEQFQSGKLAYQKLLFLLRSMYTSDIAHDIVNKIAASFCK
jgi:hypothetical protein